MSSKNLKWLYPAAVPDPISSSLASFTPPFQSILHQRGFQTAEDAIDFLLPQPPAWEENAQLRHISKACSLIARAISDGAAIGVFGDYDADGITATALMTLALRKAGAHVIPQIPNRIAEGYGISRSAVDGLHRLGVDLIITVDNGIRSIEEAAYARALGIDLIITDHHNPGQTTPDCAAVIDPKLPDDPYPNKHLAGVGVAYKLISELSEQFPDLDPNDYLDLVALGTIADIVPLLGENRFLVKQGLRQINQRPRQPVYSLLRIAGLTGKEITASDISFQIAPRLNSSGRLADDDYTAPLQLLLCEDPSSCGRFAQILENHNERRKSISKDLEKKVDRHFSEPAELPPVLFAIDNEIDLGVAGIAAGYLSRKYYLPAVVGQQGPDTTTASCRSIPEFNLIAALENIKDLLLQFGGHKLAAGFTAENSLVDQVQTELIKQAQSAFSPTDLRPELAVDAVVSLSDLNKELLAELKKLEPTGEQNPQPIFACSGLSAISARAVGRKKDHLKIVVSDGSHSFNGIGFGLGGLISSLPPTFDIAFHFTENSYRGKKEMQLQILDLIPTDPQFGI